jgi:conjugative transposon TraN protein
MNRLYAFSMLFFCLSGYSQISIPSYPLSVTFFKTTNIIFPYRIEKADIGSADVIGHKDPGLENVLFLKANRKDFAPTNLSVYTSDGRFYSFLVQYKACPDTLNLSFVKGQGSVADLPDRVNKAMLDSDAILITVLPASMHKKTVSQEMKMVLTGIYIKDHQLWFTIEISNRSELDFQPESVRFFVRDKRIAKRTAVQESEIKPVWRSPYEIVPGEERTTYVFALSAFTFDDQKKLQIQVKEKNGNRTLNLAVRSKTILKSHHI